MHLIRLSLLTLATASAAVVNATADGREPGSLLVYSLQQSALLDPTVFNVVSVTNTNRAGNATTDVHFEYVNVTPSPSPFLFANCNIADRVETLTPADTLSVLTSCHNGATNARGYLVVTARDPDEVDTPWSFDHLIGSQQVVTIGGGMYALNAIPFASPRAERAKTDVSPNDGHRDFDGVEYEPIADELYIDSFIGAIAGRIALVSLTGPEYLTNVDFIIYNDDEFQLSGQYSFACWAHVPLADISGYFTAQGLATTNDDPSELDLNCDDVQEFDTGWAIVRPRNALSITSDPIDDPAVLGALTMDAGPFNNARLLWESAEKQTNGAFASNATPSATVVSLFGADTITDQLVSIDPATGIATPVGPLGSPRVLGLAFDTHTGELYGADETTGQLVRIDRTTGHATAIGPIGWPLVTALTHDPASGTMYGISFGAQVLTIDLATGAGTIVQSVLEPIDLSFLAGLAVDTSGPLGSFFGSEVYFNKLALVEPGNTVPILSPSPQGLRFWSIENEDVNGVLLAVNSVAAPFPLNEVSDRLWRVTFPSGPAVPIGVLGFQGITDLAYIRE